MKVTLQPSGAVLEVEPGERILDAARRLGYDCPQSCRNGNCHVCAALLVSGTVRQQGVCLEQGEVFTCLAEPRQDCVVHWDGVLLPGELPVRSVSCQVLGCETLGADVMRVRLLAPAGKALRYHAGQYVLIERDDGQQCAFSLASAPHAGRSLELHVLAREDGARRLLEQLVREGVAKVQMPFGDTHLAELPDGPLVLLAAGTGMAQMQSLLEHCRSVGFAHPVHLYWGARTAADFYHLEAWSQWSQLPNLHVQQVVSDDPSWKGRSGMLFQAVCEDFTDLSTLHVYASGSPAMIYGTLDALVERGMPAAQMRADVFAYAPRD